MWGNCKEQLNDACLPGVKHPGIVGQLALKYSLLRRHNWGLPMPVPTPLLEPGEGTQ